MEEKQKNIGNNKENLQASFEALFHEHYRALARYAYTLLKNHDGAEDMVQQVFVSLWEKNQWQNAHTSIKSLLYTSVYHACLNKIKQEQVRLKYVLKKSAEPDFDKATNYSEQKELNEQINKAMEALPTECRRIFEMSRFKEMKYQEIADELNLSIKTVENQMGKALKIMRLQLKDFLPALFWLLIN